MASVFDAAKYILQKKGAMSTWKLQKLCYYAQAWALAWTGEPLFADDFEAWRNGPVCRALYQRHKRRYKVGEEIVNDARTENLTADEADTIDAVLKEYGDMAAWELRNQTHIEKPWLDARGDLDTWGASDAIIPKSAMADYYGSL